jgi:cytochrome c551/c552
LARPGKTSPPSTKAAKAEDLAAKIVSGGKGVYGKIPMPPQAEG